MTESAADMWKLLQPTWPISDNAEAVIVNQWLLGADMSTVGEFVRQFYIVRLRHRSRLLELMGEIQ